MPNCDVVATAKPKVRRTDGEGWICEQEVQCRKCHDAWWDHLAQDATWSEAIGAVSDARAIPAAPAPPQIRDGTQATRTPAQETTKEN